MAFMRTVTGSMPLPADPAPMPVHAPHSPPDKQSRPHPASTDPRPGQAEIFRQAFLLAVLVAVAAVAAPLQAQAPQRERTGTPQATGALHTVRTIPEACTRLEGMYTGDPAQPYRLQPVDTAPGCRQRARYVDPAQARPDAGAGWVLDDLVRVPDAACPQRQALVRVWRKPVDQTLELDGQGRVRIYLQDAQKQAAAGQMRELPEYSAQLELAGRCG